MKPRAFRPLKSEIYIIALTSMLIASIWWLAGGAIDSMERANRAAAASYASHMAELIAARFSEIIRQIDSLQHLGALLTEAVIAQRDAGATTLMAELRRATAEPGAAAIRVWATDRKGNTVWATNPLPAYTVNVAERDYFQAIFRDGRETFIGHPVLGAVTNSYGIPFASAVKGTDGKPDGVVVVGVDTRNLDLLAGNLELGPRDLLSLFRDDGLVLAHSRDIGIGDPVRDLSMFQRRRPDGTLDEFGVDSISRAPRFLSIRRISGTGLSVVVMHNAADVLTPGTLAVREIRRWALLISGVVALAGAVIMFTSNRLRKLRDTEARARDVTQSEELLRQIAENAPDMIALQDERRRFLFVNGSFRYIIGFSDATYLGRPIGATLHADDVAGFVAAFDQADSNGSSQLVVFRSRTAAGPMIWVEALVSSFFVPDASGRLVRRYVTISRNITGRKEAESALREAREQISTLLLNASGLIYKARLLPDGTRETTVLSGNSFLGYDEATISTFGFAQARMPPEDTVRRQAAFARCLRDGQAITEARLRAANHEMRWIRETMNLSAPNGEMPAVVGFVCDITEEHRAKQRLQQSERLASLGTVASGIAHELNQPLAAISMAAENGLAILERPELGIAPVAGKLRRIVEQIRRIGDVMDHIRRVGAPNAGAPEPFALADAMDGAMVLIEQRMKLAGAALAIDLPPGLPLIAAPRVLIEQVLVNLIVNACDAYSEPAGAALPIARRRISVRAWQKNDRLHVQVADNAGGIPPAIIGRVFDPFVTTKAPGKGTGLGLSISFATITELGGSIVAANENGGAVFDIELPIDGMPTQAVLEPAMIR